MNFRSAILILGFFFFKSLFMPVSSISYLHNPLGQNDLQSFISCDWVIESLALNKWKQLWASSVLGSLGKSTNRRLEGL